MGTLHFNYKLVFLLDFCVATQIDVFRLCIDRLIYESIGHL